MNFDKAVQGALDTLKLGKEFKKGRDLPLTYSDFFSEKSSYLDTLGLSWRQRAGCILVCFVLSCYFFIRCIMSIITSIFSPEVFGWYYTMCCIFLFVALCFFSGFKTVVKNSVSRDIVVYSTIVLVNSLTVLIYRNWDYFIRAPVTVMEVISVSLFCYAYTTRKFKMGMKGLTPFSVFH
ncbi:hypothetical protein NEFER03_0457 [Nematocida sp. LUAm3]|nr:hypothetical protein NEFER03_0457 [Nematocida sp. LUAm3]KAI5175914.1 hypothetical protein NEFER02_1774 [Nematocida sp. LUAm2]KAI5178704.1 hypothetical protein NEFER01_1823 [Nematocida sp. LUAm1]